VCDGHKLFVKIVATKELVTKSYDMKKLVRKYLRKFYVNLLLHFATRTSSHSDITR
jgi:hypothetical protein